MEQEKPNKIQMKETPKIENEKMQNQINEEK